MSSVGRLNEGNWGELGGIQNIHAVIFPLVHCYDSPETSLYHCSSYIRLHFAAVGRLARRQSPTMHVGKQTDDLHPPHPSGMCEG